MKKFYSFLFAAVALVGFAACNSDSTEEPAPAQQVGKMEFTANIGEDTKTKLEGISVVWCDTDAISINGEVYTFKKFKDDGVTAVFEGKAVTAPYTAIYPANATELKANVAEGNFAEGANIAVAYSKEGTNLSFKNVLSVLKFQVEAPCQSVTLESTSALVGAFTVDVNNEYKVSSTGAQSVTLNGNFEVGKTYFTTIFPGDHTLTIRTNGYLSTTKPQRTAVRNMIYDLKTLPAPVECEWGLVGQHQGWALNNAALTRLYKEAENLFVVKNIKLASTGFKFTELTNTNWDRTFGVHSNAYVYNVSDGWYKGIYTDNRGDKANNIKVSDWTKTYDVYLRYVQNASWGKELGFTIVEAGTVPPAL